MVSIRMPHETTDPPTHYVTRRRSPFFSPRLWKRIIPVIIAFFLLIELYRLLQSPHQSPSPPVLLPPDDPPSEHSSIDEKFDTGPPIPGLTTLIIVACHAIWLGGPSKGENGNEWILESFQKDKQQSFIDHIERGVSVASEHKESLLMFSGGETRRDAGPRTEAQSYFELAVARGLMPPGLQNRTTSETNALDSFQNLLFSLCRFRELAGTYPESVVVVSYEFKRERFVELHRRAVAFPIERFEYIGIDPEWRDEQDQEEAKKGEHENAVAMWERDPYGCAEGGLKGKRKNRNWGRRAWAYDTTCPEMGGLLSWCEDEGAKGNWFDGKLPWFELG